MLNSETKRKIQSARDILVGKVPDPKSQVEQITLALMFKFMDDMDKDAMALGAKAKFFSGEFAEYSWSKILDSRLGAQDRLNLYAEALGKMNQNPNIPQLFKNIFKNAFLPYRDPETLTLFLKQINEFTYSHSEQLGDAFEYLLSRMASQGDAGQFRTPRHIIDFIVAVVDPGKNQSILDPACGTAGFLISAYKYVLEKNKEKGLTPDEKGFIAKNFVGYDISPDMVRLSLVNMYLHGFADPQIHEYDSLSSTTRWEDKYDVILANPPFMSPKGGIKPHEKFSIKAKRSEVLFVDYILEHLSIRGKAGIIVPEGIIFQSGNAYKELRKELVEDGLYCVVSLPAGIFQPYSGVKTSILLFDNEISKHTKNLLFVKIESDGFDLGAQRRQLDDHFGDLIEAKKTILEYKDFILTGNTHNNLFLERIKDNEKIGETVRITHDKLSIISKKIISEDGDYNLSSDRYKIETIIGNQKWPMVELSDICDIRKGSPITKRDTKEGHVPVIAGGQQPAYYHDEANRFGKTITISASGAYAGFINFFTIPIFASDCSTIQVKSEDTFPEFLYYLLKSKQDVFYKFQQGGGQPHVYSKDFEMFKIPLPPLEIQQQIVDELDGYQKIISGAKQVIENWKPKIDVNPKWKRATLGELCEINPKKTEVRNLNANIEVSFVPMADLSQNATFFEAKKIRKISEVIGNYTYFEDNDVLLARVTPCFENGKAGIAKNLKNKIGFGSSEYIVIRPNKDILPEIIYAYVITEEFKSIGKMKMTGTGGLQRVPIEFIKNWEISLPPLDIQKQLIRNMEEERKLVEGNKKLIEIYEQKIKSKIAEVWGDN